MKKLVFILFIISENVFCLEDIYDQDRKNSGFGSVGYNIYDETSGYRQNWLGPNRYGGQRYTGIRIGSDRFGQDGYNNYYDYDDRYNEDMQYRGQGEYYYSGGNRGQGQRLGFNGNSKMNNQFNGVNRFGQAGLNVRAGIRAGLDLNTRLNAGLSLNSGLTLGAGLRVGLDLSLGGELDKQEDLVRPCRNEDYQCIRKFFAENSQCSPSYGPAPDPLYMDQNTLYMPYINLTYTLTNLKITGMASAQITDLYLNRVSGNVVLSIQIKDLNETSPAAYLSYKRNGKEPIILADASTILFSTVTLTVVLPKVPNLRLDLADVHAYIDDGTPEYTLGPKASNSSDPDVRSAFLQLSTNLQLVIREGFLFQAQLLAALFIQFNICDFGVNLISV